MKKPIIVFLLILTMWFSNANAIPIDVIVWEPDDDFIGSLSATVDIFQEDADTFGLTVTNTSTIDPLSNHAASIILLTGIGLNLWGDYITGANFGPYSTTENPDFVAEDYWGSKYFDGPPGPSTGFNTALEGTEYSVDTTIATLETYVDDPHRVFGSNPGIINGPSHGIAPENVLDTGGLPAILGSVTMYIDFDTDQVDWLTISSSIQDGDVAVSFGSPTAPVPEPSTMLLLGTGLIGIAGIGRKKFKK